MEEVKEEKKSKEFGKLSFNTEYDWSLLKFEDFESTYKKPIEDAGQNFLKVAAELGVKIPKKALGES
jgi:hypothetical protein